MNKTYQNTCLPFGLATSPRVHPATKTRSSMVEPARCQAARLLGQLADLRRVSRTGPDAFRDDHRATPEARMGYQLREVRPNTKWGVPVSGNAFQHSTVYSGSGAPAENASQDPALDEQPHHHSKRSTQVAGHGGVHGNAGTSWKVKSLTSPVVGCHSMVPEDWELDRQDHSSSVGSTRSGLVGITSSPAKSSPRQETEVTLFTDVSKSDWGAQLGSCLIQGQWSASLRSWHIKVLEMQAVINAVSHLRSRVFRLMCNNVVRIAYIKNEGSTRSYTLLKWCDRKAIRLVPVHLPGVRNIQVDALSRIGQTLNTEWMLTMERLQPVFSKWGEPQIDMFAMFANRRRIKFFSPYLDPKVEWTDVMSTTWDNERGLLYVFPPFKLVPQALQKIYQSHGVQMILVAPKQETASWFPELLELSQQDLILLYAEGQPPLTQNVILPDGETETGHQIYVRGDFAGHPKGKGTFTGSCPYDVKIPTSVITISLWNTLGKIRPFL